MLSNLKPLYEYIRSLEKELATDKATEQSYRSALKVLIQSLDSGIIATNEPRHIECGAPDFVVTKGLSYHRLC